MNNIEHLTKIIQQKRQADRCKLEHLNVESNEHKEVMKTLQNLRRDREQCTENITKHLNMITAHKHFIQKTIHSTKDISGLPIPHNYARDMKTMFTDTIDFLNNIGDTCITLGNNKENNIDPAELIQAVTTCTETAANQLHQTKCSITQLETLKENIAALQQHILNNNDSADDISSTLSGESTGSESTISPY